MSALYLESIIMLLSFVILSACFDEGVKPLNLLNWNWNIISGKNRNNIMTKIIRRVPFIKH